ncbi:MAG: hypothetical protein NDJ89_04950 [Oligoflexia bacterium]|nr:hypothetical protein [Oligoflexia bacterium]
MRAIQLVSFLVLATVGATAATSAMAVAAAPSPAAVASRLANVKRLLEVSSAARQVEASGSEAAMAAREKAREFYAIALTAYNSGDLALADEMLTLATRTMFEAVRMAGSPQAVIDKKRKDYENFNESITALRQALGRVAQEKGRTQRAEEISRQLDPILAEAQRLAAEGRHDEGREKLGVAYQILKGAIVELRDGDTLVKPVQFATKAEEYQYELGRNETLVLLFQVMAGEKVTPETLERVINEANSARASAASLAAGGDYEGGIATLDRSSRGIGRELNRAGVFIPM